MGPEASVLYHLETARAAEVFQNVGPNYADVLQNSKIVVVGNSKNGLPLIFSADK